MRSNTILVVVAFVSRGCMRPSAKVFSVVIVIVVVVIIVVIVVVIFVVVVVGLEKTL